MNWAQVVLPLILGLVVISWQHVHAEEALTFKGNNSTKPGNRTGLEAVRDDHDLYMTFACRGKTNGLHLPVAGSCVDYYECQEGVAKRLTCQSGMHFSSLALTCMDARLSKCIQDEPTANCQGLCCGREDGLYPAKSSCSDFLICVDGVTFERSCGGNLQFSATNKVCDIPERARCNEVVTGGSAGDELNNEGVFVKPTMYMISHRICRNQPDGSAVAIFGSCNKFYLCIDNVGYLKSCGNLQFNPQTLFCDARTRIYCPLIEQDDVILNEEEYVEVDVRPLPLPRPRPDLRPIPFNPEDYELEPPYVDDLGKRPRPESFKKEQEIVDRRRPRPPVVEEEEEMLQSGKKPTHGGEEQGNRRRPRPPFMGEQEDMLESGKKPAPEEGNQPIWGNKHFPRPPVPDTFEEDKRNPSRDRKPTVPRPPVPVDFEEGPRKPIGNKKPTAPRPSTSNTDTVSQQVATPDDEDKLPAAYSNICANQPVGALMAMPDNCSKFIRCRWDWFERRSVEVMNCPSEMHFNAKSKKCDWPANAGCIAFSKQTAPTVNKKKNKYTGAF